MTFDARAEKGGVFLMSLTSGMSFEERTGSALQADTLVSAQYCETFRRKIPIQPEKRLMLAVLQNAVQCFQKYAFSQRPRGMTLFQEAMQWILEEENDWPFSFESICESLGIDPEYLRGALLRWRERRGTDLGEPANFRISRGRVQYGRRLAVHTPGENGSSKQQVVR